MPSIGLPTALGKTRSRSCHSAPARSRSVRCRALCSSRAATIERPMSRMRRPVGLGRVARRGWNARRSRRAFHPQGAPGGGDVFPRYCQEFALAHAGGERQREERAEPVLLRHFEQPARLSRVRLRGPTMRHPRLVDRLGDVARDQVAAQRVLQGRMQRGMHVCQRLGRDAVRPTRGVERAVRCCALTSASGTSPNVGRTCTRSTCSKRGYVRAMRCGCTDVSRQYAANRASVCFSLSRRAPRPCSRLRSASFAFISRSVLPETHLRLPSSTVR